MRSEGFTLIELAVVLAIIAVLAAMLMPMVTNYLDQSRVARAQADTKTIADAIRLYQRDTGQWPVYASATDYTSNSCCGGGTLIGSSAGSNPTPGVYNWNIGSVLAGSSLETYLNANFTNVSTTTGFPKKGFRGPYVGALDSDPWGNRYILTGANLAGPTNHAFVISAGPNGAVDTNLTQDLITQFTTGSDDIVAVIK
jgi:prepilin-type N-terminal cleavage/methylation domain-containing protein